MNETPCDFKCPSVLIDADTDLEVVADRAVFPMRRLTLTIEAKNAGDHALGPIVLKAMGMYADAVRSGQMGANAVENMWFLHETAGEVKVRAIASLSVAEGAQS